MPNKAEILQLLDAWIRQRPGLEYGNYGDPVSYRAEVRSIGRDLADARQLLRAAELSSVPENYLIEAFSSAYSGRLSLVERNGKPALDYCTGQYFPTEYRRAACAVLASAMWNYYRADYAASAKADESSGDAIRRNFRRQFGRRLQSRYFN